MSNVRHLRNEYSDNPTTYELVLMKPSVQGAHDLLKATE